MWSIKLIVILLFKFSNVQVRDAAESSQPSLDREDSSSELTASRKEGTKGHVSDVSKKKNFNLDQNFWSFHSILTHTPSSPKHIIMIPKEDDLVTFMLKITR